MNLTLDFDRLVVRPARKNKMRCYVVLDTEKKELLEKIVNGKKVNHFWSDVEAQNFADYMIDKII